MEEEEERQDGAASPPAEQHRQPHHSLHHHLNLRRFHHPYKTTGHRSGAAAPGSHVADLRDAQCRKAGARLTLEVRVRARVRCATATLCLLLKSTTTATEVSPSKCSSLGSPKSGWAFFCQICRYIVLTTAKEMSVGAITLILQGLFLLV